MLDQFDEDRLRRALNTIKNGDCFKQEFYFFNVYWYFSVLLNSLNITHYRSDSLRISIPATYHNLQILSELFEPLNTTIILEFEEIK